MTQQLSLSNFNLSIEAEGILSVLCRTMTSDERNLIPGTKKELYVKFNLSKMTFEKYFEELSSFNIVKFVRGIGVYVNPQYFKKTENINKNTLVIFQINSNNFFLSGKSCVYFLYDNDDLLYVGKSTNLHKRFMQYKQIGIKSADNWINKVNRYKYIEYYSIADMNLYEVYYISTLKPRYNRDCNTEDLLSVNLPEKSISEYLDWEG